MKTFSLSIVLIMALVSSVFAAPFLNEQITIVGPNGIQSTGQMNRSTGQYVITDPYSGRTTGGQITHDLNGIRVQEYPSTQGAIGSGMRTTIPDGLNPDCDNMD
jgi:hypothetical protein